MSGRDLVVRVAIALLAAVGVLSVASSAVAKTRGGGGGGTSSSTVFAKAYSNIVGGSQLQLTPEDVQVTSTGGYTALASTNPTASGASVGWLLNLSSTGSPQSQLEVGCLSGAPGDYSIGSSLAQTGDGGNVLGGGTIGCGSGSNCPEGSGITCALVEKISSSGVLQWARVYAASARSSVINKIRSASDGGLIAEGATTDSNGNNSGLVLKLDSQGNIQWERQIGAGSSPQELLSDIQQTADGGYVATGQLQTTSSTGMVQNSVLVVKLDSSGNIVWQQSYRNSAATVNPLTGIQTSDGGYFVGGHWDDTSGLNQCCGGALLLKLDASGNVQWQTALSGGQNCFDNGFSEVCQNLTATVYTAHQTSDGSYVLTGDETLKLNDGSPLVPWVAKVDANGNLLWQHLYYQSNPNTGRPLSEYFASSTATNTGGVFGLGFTENLTNGKGELYGVSTDSNGIASSTCGDLHSPTTLNPINPSLSRTAQSLPISTAVAPSSSSPATVATTSVSTQSDC